MWVLSGMSDRTQPSDLAGYLEYQGLAASAPRQSAPAASRPTRRSWSTTARRDKYPDTIAYLEKRFKVKATEATDPAIRTDVIVIIGRATQKFSAPVGP